MTTYRQDRCIHCETLFSYQASGNMQRPRSNWGSFCLTCSEAIDEALVKVPKKFKKTWEKTKAWSVEQCLEHDRAQRNVLKAKAKKEGKMYVRKVAMSLFDLDDPSNVNKAGYVKMLDGVQYLYSYWTKTKKGSVRVAMEKNLDTGELLPWR